MTLQPNASETLWLEDFAANREDFPGAGDAWLDTLRARGIEKFLARGIPTRRVEAWHYTDLRNKLAPDGYEPATPWPGAIASADPFAGVDAYRIVLANGFVRRDLSTVPDGVELVYLSDGDYPDWLREHLGRLSGAGETAALNMALMRDGVALRVTAALDRPLHLQFVGEPMMGPRASHLRHLIVVEEGASLTLLQSFSAAPNSPDLVNEVVEIVARPGARVEHVRVIAESAPAVMLGGVFVELAERAVYDVGVLTLGAILSRTDVNVGLNGEGANAALKALTMQSGHADLTTHFTHAAPRAESRQLVKAVAGGKSRAIYQGRITVAEGADGTNAHQLARALLLSREAEADIKPELEILADDVKCGHGAAIGSVDESALFYLRSRGLREEEARSLLVEAFIADVIEAMPQPQILSALVKTP